MPNMSLQDNSPHPRHPKLSISQQNQIARRAVFNKSRLIQQKIAQSITGAGPVVSPSNVFTFNPIQVGLLISFIVEITCTINNTGAGALTLTPNGADNILSNIQFNDFTGNPRHNCSGRTLSFVEAAKYKRTPGAAQTSDSVSGFGSIVASNVAPATIANGSNGVVTRVFEIPVMVDETLDMAGALYLGVNNQNTLLKLTLNPNVVGTDPLLAVYTGTSGTLINYTINVYQRYWNNLPKHGEKLFLPDLDLATAYMIQEFSSGISFAANQENFWNYPTFSEILGTYFSYDNASTTLNAGTDLTKIRTVVSNYSSIVECDPNVMDRLIRDQIQTSMPKGSYGFFSREKRWNVNQYPSLQLGITPSSAPANTYALVGTELLRRVQYLEQASGVGGV